MWTEPEVIEKTVGLEINSYALCAMGDDDDTDDNDNGDGADKDDDSVDKDDDSSDDATESD
jgi:coenzyme PQQ precursor peptide PqqA